jgi:hypothetical protein
MQLLCAIASLTTVTLMGGLVLAAAVVCGAAIAWGVSNA